MCRRLHGKEAGSPGERSPDSGVMKGTADPADEGRTRWSARSGCGWTRRIRRVCLAALGSLGERQWGTVREDYGSGDNTWSYFSHEQARSRAYRVGGRQAGRCQR